MSTTATSLVPSSSRSSYGSTLQSTRKLAPHEISTVSSYLSDKAQNLGLTPAKSTPQTPIFSTPPSTPGKFRHPRTTEILARNASSALTERSVKGAATNTVALILSFVFSDVYYSCVTPVLRWIVNIAGLGDASQLSSTGLLIIRLIFCVNIILLLRPVLPYISQKDEIRDIPLTPSQRSLLGLSQSVQPTPNSAGLAASYITPPRYRRLSGSFSGSPTSALGYSTDRRSISANYSSSSRSTSRHTAGFSHNPSQSVARRASGSPFSPSPTASPLFHKAVNQSSQIPDIDFSAGTRTSLGASTGSGLSRSQSLRERTRRESMEPTSPTPGTTRSPQIVPGLNYKWLYDKGRKLPKSDSYGF